jgi:hypothetical protein
VEKLQMTRRPGDELLVRHLLLLELDLDVGLLQLPLVKGHIDE